MGLDTTHGCWHGAYSAFSRWREELARKAGVPLDLMEGYYGFRAGSSESRVWDDAMEWSAPREGGPLCGDYRGTMLHRYITNVSAWLPIKWEALKPDILHVLLDHSDCEGEIAAADCGPLADRLEELLPLLEGDGGGHIGSYREKTQTFIDGLRLAASQNEAVEFH